jgi:hypothetical protein
MKLVKKIILIMEICVHTDDKAGGFGEREG